MSSRTRRGAAALVTAGAAALAGALLVAPAAAAAPDPGRVPGAWIVTLVDGASPDAVAAEHGRRHDARVDHVYRHALRGYAARMSEQAAGRVAADHRVASVVPDRVVAVTAKPVGGSATSSPQVLPTGVDRVDGDLSSTAAGDGTGTVDVDVAVLDTGIASHPDLTVAGGKNCAGGNPNNYKDGNGHGTHVAGTVAAKDDGAGVVGVAPGARLWAVRVLNNQGSGTWSGIICGVDWVTGKTDADGSPTIEVANMSLGGGGRDTGCDDGGLHAALCRSTAAGITYVVAAGNSASDAAGFVPAAYDQVITVSALADFDGRPGGLGAATCRDDVDDTFADFSNHGADVDLVAPGVCIRSTWLSGGFHTISGTSMASPHVAGAAALHISGQAVRPSPAQVQQALQSAGTTDWDHRDDPDGVQEPLLGVAGF